MATVLEFIWRLPSVIKIILVIVVKEKITLLSCLIGLVQTRHLFVVTAAPVVLVAMEKHIPPAIGGTICSITGCSV